MPPDEPLDALLARTFRMLRHTWAQHAADLGLAPHQGRALRIIGSDGPMRLSALAERLHVVPRSATEVADALASITASGIEVAEQVAAARRAQAEVFFGRLSDADRAALHRILSTLGEPGH